MKHDETIYRPTNWQTPSFVAYCQIAQTTSITKWNSLGRCRHVSTVVFESKEGLVGLVGLWTHSASAITREQHCGWSGRARRLNMKVNSGCMLLVHSCGSCAIIFSCERSYILLDQTCHTYSTVGADEKNIYPDVRQVSIGTHCSHPGQVTEHRLPGLQDVIFICKRAGFVSKMQRAQGTIAMQFSCFQWK